jgi:hypothetical protein
MSYLSIRDLQKISGEAITALPGPTAVKSGNRTVGLLTPFRKADPERLKATLARIDARAAERDPEADEAFLRSEGIDTTNWSAEAVRALLGKGA